MSGFSQTFSPFMVTARTFIWILWPPRSNVTFVAKILRKCVPWVVMDSPLYEYSLPDAAGAVVGAAGLGIPCTLKLISF